MAHKPRYVVAFVVAAVCAGAWLHWRVVSKQQHVVAKNPVPAVQGGKPAISAVRGGAFEGVEVKIPGYTGEEAAIESDNSTNSKVDRNESAASSANWGLHSDANSQAAHLEMDGLSLPEGAPFPIAELIEKECASGNDLDWDCAEVRRVLKEIEDEARDTQWASSMESRIRAVVGAAPGVNIRALACSATVCVVETDGALLLPDVWNPLHTDLLGAGYVRAYDHTGIAEKNFRVELWTFRRRR